MNRMTNISRPYDRLICMLDLMYRQGCIILVTTACIATSGFSSVSNNCTNTTNKLMPTLLLMYSECPTICEVFGLCRCEKYQQTTTP